MSMRGWLRQYCGIEPKDTPSGDSLFDFESTTSNRLPKVIKAGSLAAVDTGGGVLSWQNTEESAQIFVFAVTLNVTTAATGVCTVDVGVASGATTSDDSIIDGLDIGTAAGVFSNYNDANGTGGALVADNSYVTISVATGASAGLVGSAYIHYFVA